MRSAPILVVDCGSRHVAVARFSMDQRGRLRLLRFASVPVKAEGRDAGAWAAGVGAALQTLGRRGEWGGACVLGVPGHATLVQGLEIPRTCRAARKKLLRFEAGQIVPGGLSDLVWAVHPTGGDGKREQVAITAVRPAIIEALCQSVVRAGLQPVAAYPTWLGIHADGEGCGGGEPRLLVNIGARTTTLVVHARGRDLVRNLNLGGDWITENMAEELGVEWHRAEVLKQTAGTTARGKEGQTPERTAGQLAVDRFARRLAGEISRLLAAAGGAELLRPSVMEVGGGGALASGLAENLAERLGLPLRRRQTNVAEGPPAGMPDGALECSHLAEVAGLARFRKTAGRQAASLLPTSFRCFFWLARHWRAAAVGLTLLIAGLAVTAWHWQREARRQGKELVALGTQLKTTRTRVDRDRAALARLAQVEERIGALRRLDAKRMAWVSFLSDLEGRLSQVGDVWLDRLEPATAGKDGSRRRRTRLRTPHAEEATAADRQAAATTRLRIAGRMLDPEQPLAAAGEGCRERIKALWAGLAASPFIAGLTDERLEADAAGFLRFEVTLVLAPDTLP